MLYARARGRYLAALGLTGLSAAFVAIGCHSEGPGTTSPATTTTPPAQTGAAAARHTAPWVPAVEEPAVPRPGTGMCPHGPFCVPQPDSPGASPAPAPHAMCAADVALPPGIGPTAGPRAPTVSFDAARTAAERASDPGACCYQWHVLCPGGRALRGPEGPGQHPGLRPGKPGGAQGPVTAATAQRDDWIAPEALVDAAALAPETRAALAAHWAAEAAFEHASVASFARASLALLAVGAPPDLVADTHAAALDEIEHARIGYALASAYGGAPRGPGALPASAPVEPSLVAVAVETFIDACAGESAAALALREAAAAAVDPAVRAALSRIAEDEERHAELAWRTVAWAIRAGGAEVARAIAGAADALRADLAVTDPPAAETDLTAHGVLDDRARAAIRRRAIAEVVLPCAEALLSADTREAPATHASA